GAATFQLTTKEKIGFAGNQEVEQNEGLANVILIHCILEQLFSGELNATDRYFPGVQELKENKSLHALQLVEGESIPLADLLQASIINRSPNALLMLANQVIGSNSKTLAKIQSVAKEIGLNHKVVLNVTGRRMSHKRQKTTLNDLYKVGELLFDTYPFLLDYLSTKMLTHKEDTIQVTTNLYAYGYITHGLFFGSLDSLAVVLSQWNGQKYMTVVAGARDAYHRDQLIIESLESVQVEKEKKVPKVSKTPADKYTVNIIGDVYYGEFYTDKRKRNNRIDALMTEGRAYSFDKLRPLISTGDLNICKFEAALSPTKEHHMKKRKPFVLYSDSYVTAKALKEEGFHLATLANNHLMDCGERGLKETIFSLNHEGINTIGAGQN